MKQRFTKIFLLLSLSLGIHLANAQQDPHYTQFMYNKLWLNPAYAGNSDKICATLINRNQWVGFGGGNENGVPRGATPNNLMGSIHGRIGRFGIGGLITRDELGFETAINPALAISYRHPLANDAVLSGGLNLGLIQRTLRGGELKAIDPNDPLIPPNDVSGNGLDIGAGIYYQVPQLSRFENFYAGFSATHLNQVNIEYGSYSNYTNGMHMYFMTGAEYILNGTMTLQPNILVKKDPAKIQADLNCMLIWNQNVKGGLTWRPIDAVSVLLGYQFPFGLQVGYSYDLTTSRILTYSSGSHELMLTYCFGIKTTPKQKIFIPRLTPRFM